MTIILIITAAASFAVGAVLASAWWLLCERPALARMSARIDAAMYTVAQHQREMAPETDYQAEMQRRADHDALWATQTHVWHNGWIPIAEYYAGADGSRSDRIGAPR